MICSTVMFVPILMNVFNHWFIQGAISTSITKGVITFLKKRGKHAWEELDDYRSIILLNTTLKVWARILANRLRIVVGDLIGPEQNNTVKKRSIKNKAIEDDTDAVLISLDWSKAFDMVDNQFLATVLETGGFESEFHRWINMQC